MVDEAARSSEDRSVTYATSAAGMAAFGTSADRDPLWLGLWALFFNTLYVTAAWIVANGVAIAFDLDDIGRDALGSVLVIAALTVGYVVDLRRRSRAAAELLQARNRGFGDLTVTLGVAALGVSSGAFRLRIVWASVQAIEIRNGHVLIAYLGTGRGVAIPLRAFGDDTAARDFADAARRLKNDADRPALQGWARPVRDGE